MTHRGVEMPEDGAMVRSAAPLSPWAAWAVLAGVLMCLLGGFHVLVGMVALVSDEVLLIPADDLPPDVSYTTWAWAHFAMGGLVAAVGVCVLLGQLWARLVGTWLAFLSAMVSFAFLPAYPFWGALMIIVALGVVWALLAHGGELRRRAVDLDET